MLDVLGPNAAWNPEIPTPVNKLGNSTNFSREALDIIRCRGRFLVWGDSNLAIVPARLPLNYALKPKNSTVYTPMQTTVPVSVVVRCSV